MMEKVRTALVVGAGIAGPACALALARVGIEATVVESHAGPADGVGAILTLAANGLDVLRTLGVDEAATTTAQPIRSIELADGAGHVFARQDGGGSLVSRDDLASILGNAALAAGIPGQDSPRLVGASEVT